MLSINVHGCYEYEQSVPFFALSDMHFPLALSPYASDVKSKDYIESFLTMEKEF